MPREGALVRERRWQGGSDRGYGREPTIRDCGLEIPDGVTCGSQASSGLPLAAVVSMDEGDTAGASEAGPEAEADSGNTRASRAAGCSAVGNAERSRFA